MQSDPWWSFAMAINVFLVFFLNANPRTFRQYAWLYCVICFGGPMIPAIVLISVRDHPDGLIFGDATVSGSFLCYLILQICIWSNKLTYFSCGAGSELTGALSACTRTTSRSGSSHSCQLSSTSRSDSTSFITETFSETSQQIDWEVGKRTATTHTRAVTPRDPRKRYSPLKHH